VVLLPLIVPFAVFAAFAALIFAINAKITGDAFAGFLNGLTPFARLVLIGPAKLSILIARHLTHNLGSAWKNLEGIAVSWLSGFYQWAFLAVTQAMSWPLYLVNTTFWLLNVEIPRLLRQVPHLAAKVVHYVTSRVVRVERTIVKLPKLTRAQAKALVGAAVATYVHPYLADLRWLQRHFHALTAVLPRALPIPQFPTFPNIWKRIRKLERKLTPAALLAAVVVALGRLGLGWLRCKTGNVQRAAKKICGLDPGLFESLLLDATAIFATVSVVEFANDLRKIEGEAVGILHRLIREFPASTTTG
jgi:hypothetical protein